MSTGRIYAPGRQSSRVAPVEYRDAVALYAREIGASGDIVWVDAPVNCWQVRLSLKPDDPRCRRMDGENVEAVELQKFVHPDPAHPAYPRGDVKLLEKLRRHPRTNRLMPGYVALRLGDLGVSGVVEILQRGSLLTGRGEFDSMEEVLAHVHGRNRERLAKSREAHREAARNLAATTRRRVLKIPFLPVGIEFGRTLPKEA